MRRAVLNFGYSCFEFVSDFEFRISCLEVNMSEQMPAVLNYAAEPHSVALREMPVPEIGDDDVLLAVQAVGICGSDLHQYHGKQSWKVNYPVVLGHEFGGFIVKAGSRVKSFK